jgi:hypothetical protein
MAKISISWRQKVLKSPRTPAFSDPNLIPDDDMLKAIGYIATVAAGIEDILHGIYWKYAGLSEAKGLSPANYVPIG